MTTFLSVFLGGGLGSILRHLVCSKIGNHWAVMSVNLMGAMLIGIAFEYFANKAGLRPEVRAFVITGMLGGFTTFSTYMFDFGNLMTNAKMIEGFLYLLGSLVLGIGFLFIGIKIGKLCF